MNTMNSNTKESNVQTQGAHLWGTTVVLTALWALAPRAMAGEAPLQIFDGVKYQGTSSTLKTHAVYSGAAIPNGLSKQISSLILKKGHQVCIATKEKGQGLSKMLIAVNRDIRIAELSPQFNDTIAFLRVTPVRNVGKRGHCGLPDRRFNAAWFYSWGGTHKSTESTLWSPMIAYKKRAGEWTSSLVNIKGIQEVIAFNEPDHPADAKQKKWKRVTPENAVDLLQNALSAGLRMGSPSCREAGALRGRWLSEFMKLAKEKDLRIDFICVHWYDWKGIRKKANRDDTGKQVFERFKAYMTAVHEEHGLPIWVTEWNANPGRKTPVQRAFVQAALEWMDKTPWMERYSYFQPRALGSGKQANAIKIDTKTKAHAKAVEESKTEAGYGNFTVVRHDRNSPLTELGTYWSNFKSAPYLDKDVYLGMNNLCKDEVEERH